MARERFVCHSCLLLSTGLKWLPRILDEQLFTTLKTVLFVSLSRPEIRPGGNPAGNDCRESQFHFNVKPLGGGTYFSIRGIKTEGLSD